MNKTLDMVTQLSLLKQIYSERTLWDEELQASRHVVPDSLSVKDREALETAGHEPNRFVRPQHDETITELKKLRINGRSMMRRRPLYPLCGQHP